jgi:hypothetical protein
VFTPGIPACSFTLLRNPRLLIWLISAGLLLTAFSLPETRGKSLEELEEAAFQEAPSKLRVQLERA